ncbi:TldD/PmbA family protein [Candidatus Micrarchaeota archaeon]|nr:TldD/PmbA family protein [Candidatus Micrarchaeota archaeon]
MPKPPHETFFTRSRTLSLMLYGGKIKPREDSGNEGYGVRVLRDGRLGFAYCNREGNVGNAIETAASLSRFSPKSGFSFAPKAKAPHVGICDAGIGEMEAGGLKEILDEIREGAEKYSKNTKIMVSAFWENVRLENSEGFANGYKCTMLSVYAEVMDGDGFGYYSNAFTHLPGKYRDMGLHAAEMARRTRKPKKPRAGKYTVIMEPEVIDDVIDILMPSFLGEWKRRGISILAGRKGEKFFDEKLGIYDDGTLDGTGGRPFDDEGTPSKRTPVVEKGVIRNFAYDRENAALEGREGGGQCSRPAFSTPPGTGYSNIEIAAGDAGNLEEECGKALLVYSLHGTHTANRTTGDFGVEVNAGMMLNRGKMEAAAGFMLSGNIFNLFKNIEAIEKKTKARGSFFSPRIAFGNVRVVS